MKINNFASTPLSARTCQLGVELKSHEVAAIATGFKRQNTSLPKLFDASFH